MTAKYRKEILRIFKMRKVKVALIGSNAYSHSTHVFNSVMARPDVFDIAGYVLPENERQKYPEKVKQIAAYPELTIEHVMNDPSIEAVVIETDEVHLTKYALLAARHGKHIHMEKPGGVSLAAFEELIATVKKTGKVFHTGYMFRYNPVIRETMKRIENGELGEIISVEAQMNCYHPKQTRQWLGSFPGGMMFFLGCHLVDLILQLQGRPQQIIPLNKSTGVDGVTAEDFGMAVLEYPRGYSFAKASGRELGGYLRRQLVITGTKETVELKPLEYTIDEQYHTDLHCSSAEEWNQWGTSAVSDVYDRYEDMMVSFAAMVRGEKENPYTPDYELELYKTVLECCGGAKDGK